MEILFHHICYNMITFLFYQKQCQIGVLPLGTGNDLARVLGWGSACDDDTNLPHILEKYERATTKMLDRWEHFMLKVQDVHAWPKFVLKWVIYFFFNEVRDICIFWFVYIFIMCIVRIFMHSRWEFWLTIDRPHAHPVLSIVRSIQDKTSIVKIRFCMHCIHFS